MNAADLASYHAQLTQTAAEAQSLADLRFQVIQEKNAEVERLKNLLALEERSCTYYRELVQRAEIEKERLRPPTTEPKASPGAGQG